MSSSISNFRSTCLDCAKHSPSQPAEPIHFSDPPDWPFQQLCMDYFFINSLPYLVIVDRYSGWPCVYFCRSGECTSKHLIQICRDLFANYGVPEEISSDGGPQFILSEFSCFLSS